MLRIPRFAFPIACRRSAAAGVFASLFFTTLISPSARADEGEAQWIWSPAQPKGEAPLGDCYFRKTFDLADIEEAQVHITADNQFELFINGQSAAKGVDWRQMQQHDVSKLLHKGRNVVAVRVTNLEPGAAGLAVRVIIKQTGDTYQGFSTDATWKTSVRQFANWNLPQFNDNDWVAAASYGRLGDTLPWGNEVVIDGLGARFIVEQDFEVERIMRDEEVGSLIAMTFDAHGNILCSREGGHLMLLSDANNDGVHDRVTTYCDKIQNAQGILALGTRVFVVGDGPEGMALYRLRDTDRNGQADEVARLISFKGSKGEHGAHAVRLGPDGLIYVIVGNFTRADAGPAGLTARSPYRLPYEGDLIQPKFEDPGGHAVGIPAPGGTVIRTDANGSFVELVAGGFRNPYDFAFSPEGELFTYDADMEWDRGAPWYRPTRVNHVTAGAEFGWRSGWSKWPEYYIDSLPATCNVGPGSPTGLEFYDHYAYPAKYRGALFGCDWATGRIHAFTFERNGATYVAKDQIFLEGRPLNATDCAVGPDGSLYFSTGGRGTDGGIYRVRYTGTLEPEIADMGQGIERALRQPQLDADWARAKIAAVKQALGGKWEFEVVSVAQDPQRSAHARERALDLMTFFGPRPGDELLTKLATDAQPAIRAKAARLLYQSDAPAARTTLTHLLKDTDALVRRTACESLERRGPLPDAAAVLPLLADQDRYVAFAARRLIELIPVNDWAPQILRDTRPLSFSNGAVALLNVERRPATSKAIIERAQRMLQANPADPDRVALLRTIELALYHGKLTPESIPSLAPQLLTLYPTTDSPSNRELVRLLTFLHPEGAAQKFASQLTPAPASAASAVSANDAQSIPFQDRLHIAAHASRLPTGWTADTKLTLLKFYEQARTVQGGYSVDKYVEVFTREFLANLSLEERGHLIAGGEKWPGTALSALASLPKEPGADILAITRELDQKIAPRCARSDLFRRLRVGTIAVLGTTEEPESQEYLRSVYRNEPESRDPVAMSLAQHPDGENWKYLVDSLKTAQGAAAQEILAALAKVDQRPTEAAPYRNVILLGLTLADNGAPQALTLLTHWKGNNPDQAWSGQPHEPSSPTNQPSRDWPTAFTPWQRWYAQKFPTAPPAEPIADAGRDKWSSDELLTFLTSDAGNDGDPGRGELVFSKAQCAACHRVAGLGETVGPDLTTVARRFQRKEILRSIVSPSHDISDQYASRVVLAGGKTYAGLVAEHGSTVTVLLSTGKKIELSKADVDEIKPSNISAMPTGLLNPLTLEEVADLFAYLNAAATKSEIAKRDATEKK